MKLLDKQFIFCNMFAELIFEAQRRGYQCKFGETKRSPEEAKRLAALGSGIKNSLHVDSLAGDLLLFKNGKYLTKTEDYTELGLWWEEQSFAGIVCAWGGRFSDGNHFSIMHEGRK